MGSAPQQASLSLMSECVDVLLTPCVAMNFQRLLLMGQEEHRICWWFIQDDTPQIARAGRARAVMSWRGRRRPRGSARTRRRGRRRRQRTPQCSRMAPPLGCSHSASLSHSVRPAIGCTCHQTKAFNHGRRCRQRRLQSFKRPPPKCCNGSDAAHSSDSTTRDPDIQSVVSAAAPA